MAKLLRIALWANGRRFEAGTPIADLPESVQTSVLAGDNWHEAPDKKRTAKQTADDAGESGESAATPNPSAGSAEAETPPSEPSPEAKPKRTRTKRKPSAK